VSGDCEHPAEHVTGPYEPDRDVGLSGLWWECGRCGDVTLAWHWDSDGESQWRVPDF
jgi:hypothetical protein